MKAEAPPPRTPMPSPKYWIGETVAFDRGGTEYDPKGREGRLFDRITEITVGINQRHGWQVRYYVNEYDDAIPEECILGPCAVGAKR